MTETPPEEPVVEEPVVTEETPTEVPPVEEPAPPVLVPPVQESLAEQIQRERNELPESLNPSDIVPNKPNIRPAMPEVVPSDAPSEAEPVEPVQYTEPPTPEEPPAEPEPVA